ncbi:MAG: magnesium transporter [Clostridia bacterium]|nr:magnesium transporter [Clostridia bacterium]
MEKDIRELLLAQQFEEAADLAGKQDTETLEQLLHDLAEQDAVLLISFCRALESDLLADVLVNLDAEVQEKILSGLHDDELEAVMDEVSVDDTVDIIEDLPEELVRRIAELDDIMLLLKERNYAVLKPLLASMNAIDLAEVFEETENDTDLLILFRILPKDLAAETFVEMDTDVTERLINKLSDRELKAVMDEMFLDDTVDIIEEMPASVVKRVLAQSDSETRAYINDLLKYPKDSAGSIMTIEFVSLRPTMTVDDAFERIRRTAIDKETIYTCYVIDPTNKLLGLVTAKDLMLAPKTALIEDIMNDNVIYAHTEEDKEHVARTISDYGFLALPIVDREMRLVGIVTVDDAMDVLQEENTEDIAKMAAIRPTDRPYLKTGVFTLWKTRVLWLLILMLGSTFTSMILNTYESMLTTALVACVPMIMGTGGNSGSQASVTVIRALSIGEVESRDVGKVIWKELRAAILLGATLAAVCFAKLILVDGMLLGMNGPDGYTPLRSLIVSLALFCAVIAAKLVGAILPILAKWLHLDPAVVANPFITTIVDAVSVLLLCAFSFMIPIPTP